MAIITYEQSQAAYVPRQPDGFYLALLNKSPSFFLAMNMIETDVAQRFGRAGSIEADMTGVTGPTDVVVWPTDGGAPPLPVTAKTLIPYGNGIEARKTIFNLTKKAMAFTIDPDIDMSGNAFNYEALNMQARLEALGRDIITSSIIRTAAPTADDIGSFRATLAGYSNTTGLTINQGYNANVLTQQSVVVGGRLVQVDLTAGTLNISTLAPWYRALRRCPQANFLIVPERFYIAVMDSYNRRGNSVVPTMPWSDAFRYPSGFEQFEQPVPLFNNIKMIVIPDDIYAAAGHTVVGAPGSADYDIYLIKGSTRIDDGVCFMYGDSAGWPSGQIPAGLGTASPTMRSLAGGFRIMSNNGFIATDAGIRPVIPAYLQWRAQMYAAQPDYVCRLTGVTD